MSSDQNLYIVIVFLIIHMYKKIKFTENTLQVLSLFTNDFTREYYVREVEKLLRDRAFTSRESTDFFSV